MPVCGYKQMGKQDMSEQAEVEGGCSRQREQQV